MSLIPSYVLKRVLNKADNVLTISDRSYNYLFSLSISSKKYYPYIFGNWGGADLNNKTSNTITLGYFGPPYSTRCFDKVVDFFEWISHNGYKFEKKIITRIEKKNLLKKEGYYRSKFENANVKVVSGFLSRERLTTELLEIDVFILPFDIVMSELPIVVFESLELNRKVISTPDSGVSNLVSNNKNMLILDEFSKKNYNSIVEFINKFEIQDFSLTGNKILQNNKKNIKKHMAKIKYKNGNLFLDFLSLKPIVLMSNFVFQGMRYMTFGEKIYKIFITLFFSTLIFIVSGNIYVSVVIGHLLNYILNGQFFVVYRYLANGRTMSRDKLEGFLLIIEKNINRYHPRDILFTGSFCRGKMSKSSDLDIRIYHNKGFINSLKAYFFASKLRFFGLFLKFPVDVFCFSDLSFLNKLDKIEIPVNFLNDESILKKYPTSKNCKFYISQIEIA